MRTLNPNGPLVVVGSLHHDIMVEVERQPMRGETLMGRKWFPKFGGKGGNQAVAAAQLGADTHFIGAVGQDEFGDTLLAMLAGAGVDHSGVTRVETGSGMSVAMVDDEGDYAAVVVTGANAEIRADAVAESEVLKRASALLLQNEVPHAINLAVAKAACDAGAIRLWNAAPMRPDPDDMIDLVDLLIVNAIEAEQICGQSVKTLEDAEVAAQKLCERGVNAVVTAGAAGCAWATTDGGLGALSAKPVENAQAHGAGDVFCGALAAHLVGTSLSDSIAYASDQAFRHVSGIPLRNTPVIPT